MALEAAMENRAMLNTKDLIGRRGWTRTSDHLLRRQVLYPPELRALVAYEFDCSNCLADYLPVPTIQPRLQMSARVSEISSASHIRAATIVICVNRRL